MTNTNAGNSLATSSRRMNARNGSVRFGTVARRAVTKDAACSVLTATVTTMKTDGILVLPTPPLMVATEGAYHEAACSPFNLYVFALWRASATALPGLLARDLSRQGHAQSHNLPMGAQPAIRPAVQQAAGRGMRLDAERKTPGMDSVSTLARREIR